MEALWNGGAIGVGRVLFWAQRCQGRYGGSGLFVGTPGMATAF